MKICNACLPREQQVTEKDVKKYYRDDSLTSSVFVAIGPATEDGTVVFGKNSDREPNEAQVLEYHQPVKYSRDREVQCTYMTIPQARETHGVLFSRPFWMWGAEIGVNDMGVVIGNEAVWTKMPINRTVRLTGMDATPGS